MQVDDIEGVVEEMTLGGIEGADAEAASLL